jgi:hypothetical protein
MFIDSILSFRSYPTRHIRALLLSDSPLLLDVRGSLCTNWYFFLAIRLLYRWKVPLISFDFSLDPTFLKIGKTELVSNDLKERSHECTSTHLEPTVHLLCFCLYPFRKKC